MTRSVALAAGFWGQNIGNAFFNLGGRQLLNSAGMEPFFISDQPAYATFRNETKGNYRNAVDHLKLFDFDLLVLQGPLFTVNFGEIWLNSLRELRRQGKHWAVIGGALRKYNSEEVKIASAVMDIVPPLFVATRDELTADAFADITVPVVSGIDSAFFTPKVFHPPLPASQYVAFCFDHFAEPRLARSPSGPIAIDGVTYRPRHAWLQDRAARMSKAHALVARQLRPHLPATIGSHAIVRPDHRTSPRLPSLIYRDSGGFGSDEPWSYLTLYAGSEFTYSDRVHACVATLAYGGSAMLYNPTTRRSALFEAVGANSIGSETTTINLDLVETKFDMTVEAIAKYASL